MEINRNNYELFVIDFLEGTLSEEEVISFELFLLENKDIENEIKNLNNISLEPVNIVFDDKLKLKKTEFSDELNCTYFEELCVRKIEDDLSIEQYNDFNKIIKEKKENKIIYQKILKTKLKPDLKKIFTSKGKLKKTVFLSRNFFYSMSSVAAAILFVFVSINFFSVKQKEYQALNINNTSGNYVINRDFKIENNEFSQDVNYNLGFVYPVNEIVNNSVDSSILTGYINLHDKSNIESIERIETRMIASVKTIDEKNILKSSSYQQPKLTLVEKYDYTKVLIANIFERKIKSAEEIVNNPIDLAQTAINGYNSLTESSLKLEKVYDDEGNFVALNLSSEKFDFSTNKIGR
jgi:hypothetical protein